MGSPVPRQAHHRLGPGFLVLWAGVLIFAVVLRTAYLQAQVVQGDEVQGILIGRSHTCGQIVTRFFEADPSLPIAVWCRLLAISVGLEELGLRLPFALAGIALVLLLAHASRDWMPPLERLLFVALLAVSPLLVHWSRLARPYALVALLGCAAVVALLHLRDGGSRRWFLLAAVSQAGMLVFSPTALPSIVGLGLGALVLGRRDGSPRWRAALPSVAGVALAALLLAPALPSLVDVTHGKLGAEGGVTPTTLLEAGRLASGFAHGAAGNLLAVLAVGVALAGWGRLFARDRALALAALAVLLVPMIGYGLTSVYLIERGVVFVRYQALCVPWLLGFLAYGLGGLYRVVARGPAWVRAAAGVALAALLGLHVLLGPLPSGLPPANPFGLGRSSMVLPPAPMRAQTLPDFYAELPRDAVLVEWPSDSTLEAIQVAYQHSHGRRVVRWYPVRAPLQGDARCCLRTFVVDQGCPSEEVPPGAYLVFHKRPRVEASWFRYGRRPTPASAGAAWDGRKQVVRDLQSSCEVVCGPPVFEDRWIRAYRMP